MPFMDPTVLQLAVISVLMNGELSGREVRRRLAERGRSIADTAFYRAAARMEESGFLTSRTTIRVVDGQTFKEKHYSVTGEGRSAYRGAELLMAFQGGATPLGVSNNG